MSLTRGWTDLGLPLAVAFLGLLGALPTAAIPQQLPTFRAAVDYIEADVIVTDERGQVVPRLSERDFSLRLDGRPQTIVKFEAISLAPTTRTIDIDAPLAALDVVGNEPSTTSRQFVLVIDNHHILTQHIAETQRVVRAFLEMLEPGDQTAVVFTGRSDLGIDFTSDVGRLGMVAASIRDAVGFAIGPRREDPSVDRRFFPPSADKAVDPATLRGSQSTRYRFALDMLFTLRNVSRALINSPHPRRVVVLISGGLDYDFVEFREREAGDLFAELAQVFEDARRANVTIYTIDPRGLVTPETAAAGGPPRDPYEDTSLRRRIQRQQENLRTLAERTGGKAVVSRGDLTNAVRDILVENGCFYVLGFYADPTRADGRFHNIDVRMNRSGLRVSARKGYLASATSVAKSADSWSPLLSVLGQGVPSPGVAMQLTALPLIPAESGRVRTVITVRVRVPIPQSTPQDRQSIQLALLAIDSEGKAVATLRVPVEIVVPAGNTGQVTYDLNAAMDLPKGQLVLRAGVASPLLTRVGTVHLPLVVPDLGKRALMIVGPALQVPGQPLVSAAGFETIAGLVPFQPTTDRIFAAADTIDVFARLFWSGTEVPEISLAIRGRGVSRVLAQPSAQVIRASVPLAGLAPGRYVLEIRGSVPGEKPVTRSVGFAIR